MALSNYQEYAAEILAHCPEIGFQLSGRLINRARQDIYDSRLWSFLTFEGVFVAPPLIGQRFNVPSPSQGVVSTTMYSNVVQLDAIATTALTGLTNPLITSRQFRAGPINGGVYNIAAFSPTGGSFGGGYLTLDRIYQEQSVAGAPYQVYRCYYAPCDANGNLQTDFLTFISMINPDLGYRISRTHLRTLRVEIDNMDPLRADQGLAYYVASYKTDPVTGTPYYELWPHPTYASGYLYLGRRRGLDFVLPTDALPGTINKNVLIECTLYYVSEWAAKNVGRFPQLKSTDWRFQMTQHNKTYNEMMIAAERQDDEIFLETYIPSQWSDELFLDEDMQVSTLLSTQSDSGWSGG